ncbi:MAG TPA: NAD(P)/FAD-dependent oxidoreductase [Cyanobacteria bacterium UBA11149]|nr:NAD(P)/FAD-dependent oxidoreductase [Cyanobacteria bacterium UBA11367]HBE60673.1 NAD(P)/FAD-dependent oxidoreductase [Cyanobacteria bacterium UBA11366]HBK63883.1 NAD(P)/FAD-dependent oxidoreductase [Cyanobacteria bacterium UBA11166]HBR72976.1 NAD(P)/FAD-dependent oxidoreductase [Cyanobacteria bacterium UBA11159]HBS69451.1 NAD(P)/FAD-dependent oxidoreductase [Cyanobacteria bacterium UBA11153]HBW91968.1 NAD(P)/FAD-dependent oxidoreductase [Cyanobacteria bacterium UBA11149]HCA96031.1 NAD(P)/F
MNRIIAIIGGGPAGMSSALWLKYLGFSVIIIEERPQLGGLQQLSHFQNVWYLGLQGRTGYEIAEQFRQHIEAENLSTLLGSHIKHITKNGDNFRILTEDNEIIAQGLVIATGQRVKGYEMIESIEGSHQLLSSDCVCFDPGATPLLASHVNQQIVAVVGGGDNGLVTAIRLANTAKHIHLFVRFKMRGFEVNQKAINEQIEAGKITLHSPVSIHKFASTIDKKQSIVFTDQTNKETKLVFDYLCFRLGFAPNAEEIVRLFKEGNIGCLQFDKTGYIYTDQFLRTSIAQIYAAGDVANPRDPCVATAVAQGAIVARSIEEDWRFNFTR